MKVLSFDPGTVNFSYAVLGIENLKIYKVGMLNSTLNKFNSLKQYKRFSNIIQRLLDEYKPDYVVTERFQNRGRFSGSGVEYVTAMNFIIKGLFNDTQLIIASLWKSYMRRKYLSDREEQLKFIKKNKKKYIFEMEHIIDSKTLNEHECDALGICLWKVETLRNETGLLLKLNDKIIKGRITYDRITPRL